MSNTFINSLVVSGVLSPAARDMDPREAVEQHAEANAMTFAEKASLFDQANVMFLGPVEGLVDGDMVDLKPLLIAHGTRDESYDADLMIATCDLAVVEDLHPTNDGLVMICTDQMNLAVPAGTQVEYRPTQANRCAQCGADSTNGEGFDGMCGNCADVSESATSDQDDDEAPAAPTSVEEYLRADLHRYAEGFAKDLRDLAARVEDLAKGFDTVGPASGLQSYSAVVGDIHRAHQSMLPNSPLGQLMMAAGQADYARGRGA